MYKYANVEQTAVCVPSKGIYGITPGVYLWDEYQEWLADGGVTEPWKSGEELLEEARAAKIAEINSAFTLAEQQPVSVGGHKFKGGFESGLALDAARRMMIEHAATNPPAGITTVDFFDIYGATVTLPLFSETEMDALDVCLTVGYAATFNSFKCSQLIAAVRAATTIEEVNAIKW